MRHFRDNITNFNYKSNVIQKNFFKESMWFICVGSNYLPPSRKDMRWQDIRWYNSKTELFLGIQAQISLWPIPIWFQAHSTVEHTYYKRLFKCSFLKETPKDTNWGAYYAKAEM